jgi:hypothetical protein
MGRRRWQLLALRSGVQRCGRARASSADCIALSDAPTPASLVISRRAWRSVQYREEIPRYPGCHRASAKFFRPIRYAVEPLGHHGFFGRRQCAIAVT